jgi:hypothetical protein
MNIFGRFKGGAATLTSSLRSWWKFLTVSVLVVLFAFFVWPTLYIYRSEKDVTGLARGRTELLRINRLTQDVAFLYDGRWVSLREQAQFTAKAEVAAWEREKAEEPARKARDAALKAEEDARKAREAAGEADREAKERNRILGPEDLAKITFQPVNLVEASPAVLTYRMHNGTGRILSEIQVEFCFWEKGKEADSNAAIPYRQPMTNVQPYLVSPNTWLDGRMEIGLQNRPIKVDMWPIEPTAKWAVKLVAAKWVVEP